MDDSVFFDRATVAKDWHARGFSCGMWIDHAGREWSYHAQETDELFMMISGKLGIEMKGQTIQPAIGEEIFIPAGTSHTIRNVDGKTAKWLYGQPRKTMGVSPQATAPIRERSFHPELKRKRRLEKNVAAVEVSKETHTHHMP